MPTDPLAAAVEQAVADDAHLKARVSRFVNVALDRAEQIMATGSPPLQAQLIKSVVPAMVKAMQVEERVDEYEEMRAQFLELQAEIRGGVYAMPAPEPVEQEAPTPDAPPAKPKRRTTKRVAT